MSDADHDTTPPVIALVKGGLGNQMFCYAAARALALRLGRPLKLDLVTGFRRDGYGRSFLLDRFPIAAAPAAAGEILGGDTRAWPHRAARLLSRFQPRARRWFIKEDPAAGPDQLARLTPPPRAVYLVGYWQHEGFFAAAADALRHELAPPPPATPAGLDLLERIQAAAAPVFIHVRRVRYVPRLAADYYAAAIAACLAAEPAASFFVFGDDAAWARGQLDFRGAPATIADPGATDEITDLHLMTRCRHAIVANSSFSWWGAWLSGAPGRRVWTPADPGWAVTPAAAWLKVPNQLER